MSEEVNPTSGSYTLEIRENDRRLSVEPMTDPFHNTTIRPRGWKVAWAVLRRRYKITVVVGGERERVEDVLALDPDYLGPRNRKEFMQQMLGDFAAQIAEHDTDDVPQSPRGEA